MALTADIIALARQYGRYGYRRVTALLRDAGWQVNRKRVDCQDFRVWAGMMGREETHYVPTQGFGDPG